MTLTALAAALLDAAHQNHDLEDDNERLHRFGQFLRRCRLAIPVESKSLGNFVRLPNRIGKIVSQEEFAEAIGVSRCWYGMLEAGRRVRPSISLIDRICDALMIDEPKRLQLVELGLPAFSQLLSKTILGGSSKAA
jgi:DNA-binding XRE family transcriptional regulator